MARILVVEDDELIRVSLRDILTLHGYAVSVAGDAGEARAALAEKTMDLILLDVWLPGENGITLCREIRRRSDVPVLFLTASDDEACVVEGLNAGGDDYIAKPFRSMELLARIQAALRRRGSRPRRLRAYVSGSLQIDLDTRDVLLHGKTLDLTQTESRILDRLVAARGRVLSREVLIEEIWKTQGEVLGDNALSVHISRLRGKLADGDGIETRRGVGYRWRLPVEEIYE
ncbi:MAG: response regulator transcription factor [Lachnospiraceae bacterium]|nr:response regulator transcription factor [Lachnospiraceae bacterium]